jgi:hypothetical protein
MDWLEIMLLAFLIVVVLALFADSIINVLENVFVYRDTGHGRRTREFHDAGRAAGVPYQERTDIMLLQEAMAMFRRLASDGVRDDPSLWIEAIAKAQQAAFDFVAQNRRDLLPAFGGMIRGISYGDILYPAEAQMVDRAIGVNWNCRPTEDQYAALKIVRPG